MAKKIYDSFLGGSVRNGVNITAHNLKTIQAHLEDPDVNIFDNAASEVGIQWLLKKLVPFLQYQNHFFRQSVFLKKVINKLVEWMVW